MSMSTFLTGGGAAVLKPPAPSSSPYSTLSETSSNSPPRRISTTTTTSNNKRARTRTPRKRPNQTYSEAAALLSAVFPKLFSPNKLCKHTPPFHSLSSSSSDLLPAFPAIADAGYLIGHPPSDKRIEPRPVSSCRSSTSGQLLQPGSPGTLDDGGFDAESILDEETAEGIDSIMGNLSMSTNEAAINSNSNPFFKALMGFRLGAGELELGLGLGLRRALRHVDDGEQWSSLTVSVRDIVPKFSTLSSITSSEKEEEEVKELLNTTTTTTTTTTTLSVDILRSSLLLKLNYEEVAKDWSGRGSPFYSDDGAPDSSGDILARLAEIVPSPEEVSSGADGMREASVMRYKEKRLSRLFSKKIRYQVRKMNAEQRPRMKGRFAKRPSLLQEAIEEVRH